MELSVYFVVPKANAISTMESVTSDVLRLHISLEQMEFATAQMDHLFLNPILVIVSNSIMILLLLFAAVFFFTKKGISLSKTIF